MVERKREYLGDGAYAEFDGYGVTVSTEREDGTHWVYFEPEVFAAFVRFFKACHAAPEAERENDNG
jgi:hypothetical protein